MKLHVLRWVEVVQKVSEQYIECADAGDNEEGKQVNRTELFEGYEQEVGHEEKEHGQC